MDGWMDLFLLWFSKEAKEKQTRKLSTLMSHELLHLNSPLILVLLHLISSLPTCCNLPISSRFHLSPWRCYSLQQDSGAAWSSHSSKCSHQHGFLLSSWLGKGSASDMKVCISSVALFLAARSAPKGNSSAVLHAVFFQRRFLLPFLLSVSHF